jgi:cytoskeletal protein RodZ
MTYDPNFPDRDPNNFTDPTLPREPRPNRSWTIGIGVLVALGIIAFLATGKTHKADNTPPAPPTNTAVNTPAAPLPPAAAPRAPAETTGRATTTPADTTGSSATPSTTPSATTPMPDDAPRRQ